MTTNTTTIDHRSRRLVVALPALYDEAREQYETLVAEVDFARFFQMASWQATLELAEINAAHGFMRYYRSDVTAVMTGSRSLFKATSLWRARAIICGSVERAIQRAEHIFFSSAHRVDWRVCG